MSAPQPGPWSNAEKNYLLAELIKHSSPPPGVLLSVVNNLGLQNPSWNDIPLPPGRSLNSSRAAFEEMRRMQPIPTGPTPLGGYGPQTPSPMSAPLGWKRPFPFEGSASFPTGREIRPKPSIMGGAYGQSSPIDPPPTKKKRGRPSKAVLQEREAKAGSGEAGVAPRPPAEEATAGVPQAQATPLPETPYTEQPPAEESRPLPPVSRMPISSILTPTAQQNNSQSGSSSGKRRRGRSTRSEEDRPVVESSGAGEGQGYESPYGMATEIQDTPARAAVLRHREDPDPRSPYLELQQAGAQALPTTSASDPGTTEY